VIEERGWRAGTTLENSVALLLSRYRFKPADVAQQHRIGSYRVDFAWPKLGVVLEADGWYHRSPEGSAKDAERDSWLRAQGWVIFRVDDRHGEESLAVQVAQAARLIRMMQADPASWGPSRWVKAVSQP